MSKLSDKKLVEEHFNKILRTAIDQGYLAVQSLQEDQLRLMRVVQSNPITGQPLPGAVPSEAFEPCGFAWVKIPANDAFGRYVKKAYPQKFRKAYDSGLQYWVSDFEQSMQRKEVFAEAMAASLRVAGIKAQADSRMD